MKFIATLCVLLSGISLGYGQDNEPISYPEEVHLKNIKQLTFGGDNAEAYFSFDDQHIVFQSNNEAWGLDCDQIFISDLTEIKAKPQMISTGNGRTTCAYFMPGNDLIVYASTHAKHDSCPAAPERVVDGKYVWPIYPEYDIYVANKDGKKVNQLTDKPGYDAEATVSPDGKMIVYTSLQSGDLELWTMKIDGRDKKQITTLLGYDGGAFFSPDSKKLVFRASRPKEGEEADSYKALLLKGLIQPTALEIFTCNVDGSELQQITNLGKANWAPYFHPNGKKIIFASNHHSSKGYQFNLFMVNVDGSGLEQITFDKTFDSFPMFSFDGTKLIFSSNRNNGGTHDTNIFIADWLE